MRNVDRLELPNTVNIPETATDFNVTGFKIAPGGVAASGSPGQLADLPTWAGLLCLETDYKPLNWSGGPPDYPFGPSESF